MKISVSCYWGIHIPSQLTTSAWSLHHITTPHAAQRYQVGIWFCRVSTAKHCGGISS